MSWVWDAEAPDPLCKLVLIMFADGYSAPMAIDRSSLAKFCMASLEEIDDAIDRLVETGFLDRSQFGDQYRIGGFIPHGMMPQGFGFVAKPRPQSEYVKKQIGQGLRMRVFERDGFSCVTCGKRVSLTVDHIHPEVRGGTLDFDNLQTLCKPCNSRKKDRLP